MNFWKNGEEDFSTTQQLQDSNTYSSRYKKIKKKIAYSPECLPFQMQKAAITIQRFWRLKMAMRRLFYEQMIEQLTYENNVTRAAINHQRHYLNGIRRENDWLVRVGQQKVNKSTQATQLKIKQIAKQCISVTFKLQKWMLSKNELNNLLESKAEHRCRVEKLKMMKEEIRNYLLQKNQEEEEMILRQIKEGNAALLRATSEKNALKHDLMEKMMESSKSELSSCSYD